MTTAILAISAIRSYRSAVMAAIFVTLGVPALNRLVEPDRRRSSLSATYSVTGQKRHFGDDMAQYRTLFEGDGWPVLLSTRGRSLRLRDNQRSQGMQTDDAMIASSLAHQFVRLV